MHGKQREQPQAKLRQLLALVRILLAAVIAIVSAAAAAAAAVPAAAATAALASSAFAAADCRNSIPADGGAWFGSRLRSG